MTTPTTHPTTQAAALQPFAAALLMIVVGVMLAVSLSSLFAAQAGHSPSQVPAAGKKVGYV